MKSLHVRSGLCSDFAVLYKVLGEKDFFANDVKNICLEMILCKQEEGAALPKEKIVTLERFGLVLSWYVIGVLSF